jgi:hypothetical protein
MRTTKQQRQAIRHRLCYRRPDWSADAVERELRRAADRADTMQQLETAADAAALVAGSHPSLIFQLIDVARTGPASTAGLEAAQADDPRFIPGTRIRKDDPYPGDRDPVTGRTDPVKQHSRISALIDGPPLTTAPPATEEQRARALAELRAALPAPEPADRRRLPLHPAYSATRPDYAAAVDRDTAATGRTAEYVRARDDRLSALAAARQARRRG